MAKLAYQLPRFPGKQRDDFFDDNNQMKTDAVVNHPLTIVHTKEEWETAEKSPFDTVVLRVDGVDVIYGLNEKIW